MNITGIAVYKRQRNPIGPRPRRPSVMHLKNSYEYITTTNQASLSLCGRKNCEETGTTEKVEEVTCKSCLKIMAANKGIVG